MTQKPNTKTLHKQKYGRGPTIDTCLHDFLLSLKMAYQSNIYNYPSLWIMPYNVCAFLSNKVAFVSTIFNRTLIYIVQR